jgi:mono/diheme cytochrome c family protein
VGRPALLIAAALLGALLLAGCNSEGVVSPSPKTVVGSLPTTTTSFPVVPAYHLKGDPTKGKAVFASAGCGGCHTLKAANTNGTVGPNLDDAAPPLDKIERQVVNGGGAMPAFKGTLSTQQIADVSAFVVKSTGGSVP